MSIMHKNFTLGNIYSLTPAQERMVAEINAADAKRADELAASLEAIAVQALADVAQLSATDAALAGENAALRLALSQEQASHTCTENTLAYVREERDRMVEQRDEALADLGRAAKRYEMLLAQTEFLDRERDAERNRANINEQQAKLNAHTIQSQAIAMHETETRLYLALEQLKHDAELLAEGGQS